MHRFLILAFVALSPSAGWALTDTADELIVEAGEQHTLTGAHEYAVRVVIEEGATLFIAPYDGQAGGTLELSAPRIQVLGVIDGHGRGFGGGEPRG